MNRIKAVHKNWQRTQLQANIYEGKRPPIFVMFQCRKCVHGPKTRAYKNNPAVLCKCWGGMVPPVWRRYWGVMKCIDQIDYDKQARLEEVEDIVKDMIHEARHGDRQH